MMVWRYIFNEQYGHLNAILRLLGLANRPIVWLGDPKLGFAANVAVEIWTAIPLMTLILMSGLQTIPDELYDAASLDGASRWRPFRHVTLPLLLPVLITGTLLFSMWTFNSFSTIWIMTKGGPVNTTDTLVTYTYKVAFQYQLFNQAMALAVIILIVLASSSAWCIRIVFSGRELRRADETGPLKADLVTFLVVVAFLPLLFPFYIMLVTSIKTLPEVYKFPPTFLPEGRTVAELA